MSATNIDIYLSELEVSKRDIKGAIQAKGVTPTGGLSSYAEAILSIPTGAEMAPLNETITESGVYNYNPIDDGVGGYNSVEINVDIPIPTFETQSKEVTIKKNGTTSIVPDSGYDGLSKVDVTVQVASTTGKPQIFNGFAFTGGDIAQVDFSQYDWSMVYDTSNFFEGCTHSTGDWSNFLENFNGEILSGYRMFSTASNNNIGVSSIPNLGDNFSKVTDMSQIFKNNSKLTDISPMYNWNTRNVTNASEAFCAASSWGNAPQITDIDLTNFGHPDGYESYQMFRYSPVVNVRGLNAIGGESIFSNSRNLETVSGKFKMITSTSNAPYTFASCSKLRDISGLEMDTSNVTNMSYMFDVCSKLTTIPQFDTSNVTNMYGMFYDCYGLTTIPQLDTSNVTNIGRMFYNCSNLIELSDFNCVKVANFGTSATTSWIANCNKLQKLGVVDCDSVTNIGYFFGSVLNQLTDFGGCRNLGKASSVSNTNGSYFMAYAPNLTYESVMNVINGLYDRASAGLSVLTLKLHANHLAMLSADDIAIATNKGWTIV